ncbi:hypothetical protein BDV18DRAFT_12837 [Aspergillus unguis]
MANQKGRILAPASAVSASIGVKHLVKKSKASRACSACREKKVRCSGGVPCQKCCESHTVCLVDTETDKRRGILLGRKLKSLEDMITDILQILRNEEKSQAFLAVVRSNAALEQIQQFLARDPDKDPSGSNTNFESTKPRNTQGPDLIDNRDIMDITYVTARNECSPAL